MLTTSCTRCIILLAGWLLLLPALGQAQAPRPTTTPPLAWLGLQSYQRLEQRVRSFAAQAQTPAIADLALGMLQLQLGGLQGLDRQRPVGLVVPTLPSGPAPAFAVSLPYTDHKALLSALRAMFPQSTSQGNVLEFKAKAGSQATVAFGRVDDSTRTLLIAPTRDALQGLNAALPADFFGTADGGADVVVRIDADTARQRHQTEWKQLLNGLDHSLSQTQQEATQKATTAAERVLLAAYMAMVQQQMRQFLTDLSRAEGRITLAPEGWVFALETQVRPGSPSAVWFPQQPQRPSRAATLLSPEATMRTTYVLTMTDDLRRTIKTLLQNGRQVAQTQLAAETALPPTQREAMAAALPQLFQVPESWLAQEHLDMAFEMPSQSPAEVAMTGWIIVPDSGKTLHEILNAVDKLSPLNANPAPLTRNVMQHRQTPIHRLELSTLKTTTGGAQYVFVAAQGELLTFHVGTAPEPLLRLLDRLHTPPVREPVPMTAVGQSELFLAPLFQANLANIPDKTSAETMAPIMTKLRDVRDPIRIDVTTRPNTATMRYVIPGSLVQLGAESLKEVLMQGMQESLQGK